MSQKMEIPTEFKIYVESKIEKNGKGGRPHFLQLLAKDRDAQEELLNILELAWIKNRSFGSIARKYKTKYDTIYRMVNDLEPFKNAIIEFLQTVPRQKRWYIKETDSSDYETVQAYIKRARRDGVKHYKTHIINAMRCWRHLKYRDPDNWNADEVCEYLATLSRGAQSTMLDSVRQVAPHLKELIKTGRFREKLKRRKKDVFGKELNMIHEPLKEHEHIKTIFDLHITLGAREGSTDTRSGITGISWERFKKEFTIVDLFESKVRGGIFWRNCPVDLFFKDLPERLKNLWIERGKPTNEKVIVGGYKELLEVYKQLRKILIQYYKGKIEPSLLKEFATIKPHDADKIHVNLLWEAKIPLEVVAGEFLGQGEGLGLVGRGWLDINTIKKYYLSLTQRSERFQEIRNKITEYSKRFNGGSHND